MLIQPRKALNKAFLKIKPNRFGIELFKQNLIFFKTNKLTLLWR